MHIYIYLSILPNIHIYVYENVCVVYNYSVRERVESSLHQTTR